MTKFLPASPTRKVLLIGCGVIGGHVLDLLAREGDAYEVTVLSRREQALTERVNLSLTLASIHGRFPTVHAKPHDIQHVDSTAALIEELSPDVIVNASSRQTFWEISTLPADVFRMLDEAKIGPWLPNHLALARRLMLAVAQTSKRPAVVNVAFPDAVNAALGKVGLAPLVGAGNVANAIPTLRRAVAAQLRRPAQEVEVRLIAHHYATNAIASTGSSGGAPVLLRVSCAGSDVTHAVDQKAAFKSFVHDLRRTRGINGQVVAATNAFAMVKALVSDEVSFLHAPGPEGRVGGYPVRVSKRHVEIDLPEAIDLAEAERVNEAGQRMEGIESISESGEIVFSPSNMEILNQVLGYRHDRMQVHDVDAYADELQSRYASLRSRLGLKARS